MNGPLRAAVDLGSGSGRVVLGGIAGGRLEIEEIHRFRYGPRPSAGHLRWDMAALHAGIEQGLRAASDAASTRGGRLASIGVASWGVDYGLLDAGGRLLEEPIAYRDPRTDGAMDRVFARVPREEIYARTGIQFLPFNTLYQLHAHAREGLPEGAARLLMIPDLCHHRLCGSLFGEVTNASTTQMWSATSPGWDRDLLRHLDLPGELLPDVVPAGTTLGRLLPERRDALGLGEAIVVAPATHDTGSAVAGTPLRPGWAYVSSGTWSLVGVERRRPILSPAASRASFTNEAGVDGTVRFLKNVMGLWLLESCREEWRQAGRRVDLDALLGEVAARPGFDGFVFPDDARLLHPASMLDQLGECLRETGQTVPGTPAAIARIVLDSLALRYASILTTLEELTSEAIEGIHVVGGGSLNAYLAQATADATGRVVLAGPVEATAAGNLLVQAIAGGDVVSLTEGREAIARAFAPRRYEPRGSADWTEARRRYRDVEWRATEPEGS